ncbi:hypothetical protein OPU71_20335, partial [Niveibacterium sp. 24ML]|uniref:hypothetical protein n=1 Tax=Niveibacterium sp. 24ML TaxID=2985512 RepID=UPI00226F7953
CSAWGGRLSLRQLNPRIVHRVLHHPARCRNTTTPIQEMDLARSAIASFWFLATEELELRVAQLIV